MSKFTMKEDLSTDDLLALWEAVERWVVVHDVRCADSIYQRDALCVGSMELAETCCNIVGYCESEEDE